MTERAIEDLFTNMPSDLFRSTTTGKLTRHAL